MILGHAHPAVVKAAGYRRRPASPFGAPTEGEIEMARKSAKLVPSIEQVRLVSVRHRGHPAARRGCARGFTGRDLIIKFEGCYHGHADSLLVKAGSGLLTFADTTQNAPPRPACPPT